MSDYIDVNNIDDETQKQLAVPIKDVTGNSDYVTIDILFDGDSTKLLATPMIDTSSTPVYEGVKVFDADTGKLIAQPIIRINPTVTLGGDTITGFAINTTTTPFSLVITTDKGTHNATLTGLQHDYINNGDGTITLTNSDGTPIIINTTGGSGGTFTFDAFTVTGNVITLTLNGETKTIDLSSTTLATDLSNLIADQINHAAKTTQNILTGKATLNNFDGTSLDVYTAIKMDTELANKADLSQLADYVLNSTYTSDKTTLNATISDINTRLTTEEGKTSTVTTTDNITYTAKDKNGNVTATWTILDTHIFNYIGDVPTVADLPTGQPAGTVAHVVDEDKLYLFNGTDWQALSLTIDLSNYYNKLETNNLIDAIKIIATNNYEIQLLNDGIEVGSGVDLKPDSALLDDANKQIVETYGIYQKIIDLTAIYDKIDTKLDSGIYNADKVLIENALNSKVDTTDFEASQLAQDTVIDTKVNTTAFNLSQGLQDNRITNIEEDLTDLQLKLSSIVLDEQVSGPLNLSTTPTVAITFPAIVNPGEYNGFFNAVWNGTGTRDVSVEVYIDGVALVPPRISVETVTNGQTIDLNTSTPLVLSEGQIVTVLVSSAAGNLTNITSSLQLVIGDSTIDLSAYETVADHNVDINTINTRIDGIDTALGTKVDNTTYTTGQTTQNLRITTNETNITNNSTDIATNTSDISALDTRVTTNENNITDLQNSDINLQNQIDNIEASRIFDYVVPTFADLPTTAVDNDLALVLSDNNYSDLPTYYKWVTSAWVYQANYNKDYYTKSEMDSQQQVQNTNIQSNATALGTKANNTLDNVDVGTATAGQKLVVNDTNDGLAYVDDIVRTKIAVVEIPFSIVAPADDTYGAGIIKKDDIGIISVISGVISLPLGVYRIKVYLQAGTPETLNTPITILVQPYRHDGSNVLGPSYNTLTYIKTDMYGWIGAGGFAEILLDVPADGGVSINRVWSEQSITGATMVYVIEKIG